MSALIEIEALRLKNVGLFKNQLIPISTSAKLTVVTGHNKDSVSSDQKNAAGKSLAFSPIPNVFYQSAPLSIKKNSKRDLLRNKTSQTSIILKSGSTRYRIDQSPSKYKIFEYQDNKFVDQKVRTDKIQRTFLTKIFNITQTEFYSWVYIQTQRPLDFQIGSPAQRLDFITEVFQLNVFDRLRQFFNNKLTLIKDDEVRAKVIASKLQSVNQQLSTLTWTSESKTELDSYKKDRAKLDKQIEQTLDQVQSAQSLLTGLKSVMDIDRKLDKLRHDYPFDTGPEETLTSLKQDLKIRSTLSKYKTQLSEYKQALASINKKLSTVPKPKQREKDAYLQLETYTSELDKLTKILSEQKELIKSIDELKASIRSKRKSVEDLKVLLPTGYAKIKDNELEEELAICSANLKLRHLLDHDDNKCPTCLQGINPKILKKVVAESKTRQEQLLVVRKYRAASSLLEELRTELAEAISKVKDTKGLVSKISYLKQQKEDVQAEIKQIGQYKSLIEQHTDLLDKKPTRPKLDLIHKDLTDAEVETYLDQCHEILKLLSSKASLYEAHTNDLNGLTLTKICKIPTKMNLYNKQLNKQLSDLNIKLSKLKKKNDRIKDNIRTLELSRERYSVLETQRLELEKELSGLKPIIEKRKTYEVLVKAYSKKGLKIDAAMACLKLLEQKLNEYASLIFFESFQFKIQQVAQGITCTVHKKDNTIIDISLLSGSETNCFRLLFMVSMLSLVPPDRRTNFVVLDEADSAMDDQARHMFINTFLPALQQAVPHVFVITPGDPHIYPNADIWTVVKEKGSSSIIRSKN